MLLKWGMIEGSHRGRTGEELAICLGLRPIEFVSIRSHRCHGEATGLELFVDTLPHLLRRKYWLQAFFVVSKSTRLLLRGVVH